MEELNLHQTPKQIIEAATPAQRILWNYIFLRFGQNIGVSQFFYQGLVVGSEIATYNARKIYFGLQIIFSTAGNFNGGALITLYDQSNVANQYLSNTSAFYNSTAAAKEMWVNSFVAENILFSRIVATNIPNISFIGYRLSI